MGKTLDETLQNMIAGPSRLQKMKTIENYLSRSSKMMVCWEIRSGRPSKPNLLGMSCQADSKPFRLMFKFSVRNPNYAFMCTCIHTLYQLRYMTYMYIYI